ncbi:MULTISPECIES: prepilin peptidase [unclassified Janthinobacterium]|uniref:A24 family peptidase n=1 Tax=unclassified Janthinobacterium TaxID=2610881 RepID=UPI00088547F6|nr:MULTISPECIES: prepilin peptidase [unclassified Janthinobacterium]SDA76931.1 prepilin peptidase CpaA [Janthinobacterium sp. 551a]SFB60515.1 prepilin peptidase CpaA [Janthinobacterium sp. 344]
MYTDLFLTWSPAVLLTGLLLLAVYHDVRSRRIPNRLVFSGALAGMALNTLLPAGAGLLTATPGALGFWPALGGLALGLALLMPMYAIKTLGAGDVKLMAMVGAFVGPHAVFFCLLSSMLAGGVLALAVAAFHGTLRQAASNSYHLVLNSLMRAIAAQRPDIDAPAAPSGKLPYAIAIASGTLLYLLLAANGRPGMFA